jgi:nucleoside 2-deoxyribosyltransferase
MSRSVYLAGPDVFYPDAPARGVAMQAVCQAMGWVGLYPLDAALPANPPSLSRAIYEANRNLIDRADAVVANLRDFRGAEPDSGTVWEVAYALARGKPVVGYLPDDRTVLARMGDRQRGGVDAEGCVVEDFGLPLNLMLAHSLHAVVVGSEPDHQGLRAALAALAVLPPVPPPGA